MRNNNIKFDFDDISLIPETLSRVTSRNNIMVYDENNKLPIFVSPMDTVVDDNNYKIFSEIGFYVTIPRNKTNDKSKYGDEYFISYGLEEIDFLIKTNGKLPKKILIDVANAHSVRVFNISKIIKEQHICELMIGNIANPETYKIYSEIGVDYIRCGIGAGNACITSANSSIHYPMGSLINECYKIKKDNFFKTKIIADGGFKNYDEIIKALGIGADGVMIGSIINKSIESCGENYIYNNNKLIIVDTHVANKLFNSGVDVFKSFRGMSTKEVQKKWGKENIKTSEGISKLNKVEYSISSWKSNFVDYLKSCMSYQNKLNIKEFIGNSKYVFITEKAHNRFYK